MNDEKTGLTSKYFYEEVKHFRDFEIKHLWQRSVFLVTFLVATVTAYVKFVEKLLFFKESSAGFEWKLNLIAIGFTYIGIIFSFLWIMMAKGSKRLYEQHEEALSYFISRFDYEKESPILDSEEIYSFVNFNCKKKYREMDFPFYGYQPEAKKTNYSLFSTDGGKYSVSRINIMIGIVCLCVWIILNLIHGYYFFDSQEIWLSIRKYSALLDVLQFTVFFNLLKNLLQCLCRVNSNEEKNER